MKRIYALLTIFGVSLAIELISQWPWWTYLIACSIIAALLPAKAWSLPAFVTGFISGFLIWSGATLFYHTHYTGQLLNIVAELMTIPLSLLFVITGLIGGLLSGLAVYSGYLVRNGPVSY
jgi:hypothetical protein